MLMTQKQSTFNAIDFVYSEYDLNLILHNAPIFINFTIKTKLNHKLYNIHILNYHISPSI